MISAVLESNVVVGALTRYALHHSMFEFRFGEFEQSQNAAEATKNICCAKGESALDQSKELVEEMSIRLQEPRWSGKVR